MTLGIGMNRAEYWWSQGDTVEALWHHSQLHYAEDVEKEYTKKYTSAREFGQTLQEDLGFRGFIRLSRIHPPYVILDGNAEYAFLDIRLYQSHLESHLIARHLTLISLFLHQLVASNTHELPVQVPHLQSDSVAHTRIQICIPMRSLMASWKAQPP
ncbi:hypothetical protein K469DRAFT_681511 [Zopfia rhizophila CBS 207.26]|uniref:Uncharacterized protein n=1 Tax=Zopfia rhizophila CBS 207.26 TaxID=1314779 RepID=A0A6A6EVD7_9PEZI|nr:hypothetical protein K469DRAFT_681511 [Zopfia rhizophila CBS 207.26]